MLFHIQELFDPKQTSFVPGYSLTVLAGVCVFVSVCVFYSFSLASLASMALVATWACFDSSAACSAGPCDWAFFNRKWLMKSFKPSRSIPSLGIPEILVEGKQLGTLIPDFHIVPTAKHLRAMALQEVTDQVRKKTKQER